MDGIKPIIHGAGASVLRLADNGEGKAGGFTL